MKKAELRKLYLQKRESLSEANYLQASLALYQAFFTYIDLSFIKTVHLFLPIKEKREPDTWLMLDRIRREFPHVRLSLPKIKTDGNMENIYFEGLHQLEKNKWGIEEPRHGVPTPIEKIELVIVPLLCFDALGNRVGYGKGYYDQLLAACRPDTKKIGLSLFDEPVEIDDIYPGDIKLTHCLTPSQLITF